MRMKKDELLFEGLSYRLNGILFAVHNELGRFSRERQYADLFEAKLQHARINYEREKELPIEVGGKIVRGNKVVFVIEGKVLVDLKAKSFVTRGDYYQMQRYLGAAKFKLGMIVNFHRKYLHPKRIINYHLAR